MADYWKSQPKKFCSYCKCWIADNKPSIDFHERGKNHKENVAKKISEIKQKSLDKAKEDAKMAKEFAAMEEAATKAYQEDLKRLGLKAEPVAQPSLPVKQEEKKEKKEKKEKEKKEKKKKGKQANGAKEWVCGFSPEGYTYYYNTKSGESQWEKPEGFHDTCQNSEKEAVWIEGIDDNGHTYYYNKDTGVSTWEKPAAFISCSIKNNPDENSSDENSKNESQKRKTGSDGEKPHKPQKVSPYGEWQQVEEDKVGREKSPAQSSQKSTPLGKWEKITEDNPYENVDLELPSTDSVPVLEVSEYAKIIFKEKNVTSLGEAAEEMPVFKKRKFENGKPRNIRQRLDDH